MTLAFLGLSVPDFFPLAFAGFSLMVEEFITFAYTMTFGINYLSRPADAFSSQSVEDLRGVRTSTVTCLGVLNLTVRALTLPTLGVENPRLLYAGACLN